MVLLLAGTLSTALDVALASVAAALLVVFATTLLPLATALELIAPVVVEGAPVFVPLSKTVPGLLDVKFAVAKTVTVTVPFAAPVLFPALLNPVAELMRVLVALPAVAVMETLSEVELVGLAVTLDVGLGFC